MNVRFVVVRPESKRKTFSVRLPITIGRSEEAKFRIQQDRVSRRHCEIFEQDGSVYLRDLGSTNGTFLNGELVAASTRHPLEPGVLVRVGSLEFRVEFEAAGAAVAAPVAVAADEPTVSVAKAADSVHLEVEHVEEPLQAVEPAVAEPAVAEAEPPAEGLDFLTVERPAVAQEAIEIEAPGEAAGPADEAFGFLGGEGKPAREADDDLGDFLKGLG